MAKYEATIRLDVLVHFGDDGRDNLKDQAVNALYDGPWFSVSSLMQDCDFEVVGQPKVIDGGKDA